MAPPFMGTFPGPWLGEVFFTEPRALLFAY